MISISTNPGQTIAVCLQVTDSTGSLHDGYQAPTVDFILLPNSTLSPNYPINMTEVTRGIWRYLFNIPSGYTGLGSYLISCSWPHPDTAIFQNELFLVHASLAFGNSSISPL